MIGLQSMMRSPSTLELESQHAVGRRMLRPEVELHLLDVEERLGLGRGGGHAARDRGRRLSEIAALGHEASSGFSAAPASAPPSPSALGGFQPVPVPEIGPCPSS